MAKSWQNHGKMLKKSWKDCRKNIGRILGKFMENSWKNHEKIRTNLEKILEKFFEK